MLLFIWTKIISRYLKLGGWKCFSKTATDCLAGTAARRLSGVESPVLRPFLWEQTDNQDQTAPLTQPASQNKTLSVNITITTQLSAACRAESSPQVPVQPAVVPQVLISVQKPPPAYLQSAVIPASQWARQGGRGEVVLALLCLQCCNTADMHGNQIWSWINSLCEFSLSSSTSPHIDPAAPVEGSAAAASPCSGRSDRTQRFARVKLQLQNRKKQVSLLFIGVFASFTNLLCSVVCRQ